jgi:5'-nucleotidase
MSKRPEILLTNDDGIDSRGLHALAEGLSDVGDVTVVVPLTDQSAVGRSMSTEVDVHERDLGYALSGTPADCVVAGLNVLCSDPDLVVAGCNRGANLGMYVLGRSGTISAAVEAAFFDVPAIATSLYIPTGDKAFSEVETTLEDYAEAVRSTKYLAKHALENGIFGTAEYLNVNAPMPGDEPAPMRTTRPAKRYEMDATHEEGTITLHDRVWDRMATGDIQDPPETDRRTVLDGAVSVSPLTAPHSVDSNDQLIEVAAEYEAYSG